MALRSRAGRCLVELVQQQLLAVGKQGPVTGACVQVLIVRSLDTAVMHMH